MSAYVWGTSLSYSDYLQAKSFVGDMDNASREAGRRVEMEVSRQTREIIASQEAMKREHIAVLEQSTQTMKDGFEQVSYGLYDISERISELNATFHWGFSEMLVSLGHMNDSLSELVKIAKTPVQTVAFNHFEIARDAFRQGLYHEALEELEKAVSGDHTSPGYKLEWRFHHLRGLIYLGFFDCDVSLTDPAKAEESFLAASRYARKDYPEDAGRAFLSAGWAAYCQGKMSEALNHTEKAIATHPELMEAFFQASKVLMAMNEDNRALSFLRTAIEKDSLYALKAAGDGDFKKHEAALRDFLEALRKEKCSQLMLEVARNLEALRGYGLSKGLIDLKANWEKFLAESGVWRSWSLMDVSRLGEAWNREVQKNWLLTTRSPGITGEVNEVIQEPEAYEEKVCVKPGGFFRRAEYKIVTKTRMVSKRGMKKYVIDSLRFEIRPLNGPALASMDFCTIPAGDFMMGDKGSQRRVTISKDFNIGRYPVTQALWKTFMGYNPSKFAGGKNYPVETVSWDDAWKFIDKLNVLSGEARFRLPTEAEWEYACRAGNQGAYCFGDDDADLDDYAWFNRNSGKKIHPIGTKKPNAWGLYDMHGNVWEWCQDWYGEYPAGPATDPTGSSLGAERVNRGGCWDGGASYCRSAYRYGNGPGVRSSYLGFRLVESLSTEDGRRERH